MIRHKNLFRSFVLKYFFYYNLFGYLAIFASVLLLYVQYQAFIRINNLFPRTVLIALLFCMSLYTMYQAVVITFSFSRKWKFYRITVLRMQRYGYQDKYFETALFEPCMRIITKDILRMFALQEKYKVLLQIYGAEDQNILKQKQKLMQDLEQLNADSITFK